ncbi:surface lipoprotein assembly modifier [Sphingomonas sp. SUN039]|uniref:surface lipoprotein assembly modifier n=1 Tax=Sphingomonas sp. SUN039 TaxID=2937787 RepID=UPI0021649646|nr:surface lipoprotein assembly modifier [Sphingomonas sp. SUN039]UVO52700.1 surface lipoprotein assembly modifier [Sphingomonas sp. SUN039]
MRAALALPLAVLSLSGVPLAAAPLAETCANGTCQIQLTPDQLLGHASALVEQRRFEEARPFIAALRQAPSAGMEAHFLAGYVAVETGDTATAIKEFRASLAIDPKQTRVRLELARALMMQGKDGGAAYHFRLAAQDGALTPEIRATIQAQRGILRDRRPWHVSTEFGFAPDTNINSGTSAETVDLVVGNQTIPLTLDENARARSGLGQTASISAGWRFKIGERGAFLVDGDAQGVNYKGTANDDYTVQLAAGPEFRPSEETSISLQGLGLQRWYGGDRAVTQLGARLAVQHTIGDDQRVGLTLDARHSASGFQEAYSGWNFALYATYERVVARSLIASASLFARADRLNEEAYSSKEFGLSLGLGGELPHGINAGITGTASRATYGAPLAAFSDTPRADWRLSGRIYAGVRALRVMGFSPSVSYTYTLNASSLSLYESKRSRFAFNLARYF